MIRIANSKLVSGVFKTNQGAAVVVSHNYFDNDFRVVAIDKQGQLHVQQGRGGSSAGGIYQCQATFSGLSPEDIARFEFQTRDYEWVEFKDLPLNPKREL